DAAAQKVLAQRDGSDEPEHGNDESGLEVERAATPDAEQHEQRERVDVHGVERNDAVGRARAAQQAPQVEQQRAGHHDQGDAGCGIDHSKISISGLSYRSFMRRTAVSASSTSRSWTSRLRRSPLRFA